MIVFLWAGLFMACLAVLAYQRASVNVSGIALLFYGLCFFFLSGFSLAIVIPLCAVVLVLGLVFALPQLRRLVLTQRLFSLYQRLMPAISKTEEEALEAGGVGWEAELFTGRPNWDILHAMPSPKLSAEEQAFIEGPVETLCRMTDSWKMNHELHNIPTEVWDFLKQHGFFGLIIPKRYGGKEFSALGHSEIISKVASLNLALATVISVPNSLGPAELLLRYGTDQQKDYYLPRLAQGLEIPCFALTSPVAGSDAGSIIDSGVLCRRFRDGLSEIGIRLNWNKRYITLAPVATLLGLAFKLYDPEHLMGAEEDLGITCALIPTDLPGIRIGHRHIPLMAIFPNGPTQGEDVFISLDRIIGGFDRAGQGWMMLMECLAAGRGISLPSLSCGGAKKSALASGAYARIRRQFDVAIEEFGGIEEVLARMAAHVYLLEATRVFTVNALDHQAPSAIAAGISKYHCTELSRQIISDSMDVHGGKGICMGPNNYLAQGYIETPIGITVEGANILTRSMIIFGQGALRGHPYLLTEMRAAKAQDLVAFDKAFFAHIGSVISNFVRSFALGASVKNLSATVFRGNTAASPENLLIRYYHYLDWFSASFALLSDFAVVSLGSKLKFKEKISGRLGDILSYLYMASAVLNYFRDSENPRQELPVVEWVLQDLFFKIQSSIQALFQNLPYAKAFRFIIFPRGFVCKPPSDHLGSEVAELLVAPSELRRRIAHCVYMSPEPNNLVGRMEAVLAEMVSGEMLEHQLHQAVRKGLVKGRTYREQLEAAVIAQVLTQAEMQQLQKLNAVRQEVIAVDDFLPEQL